MTTAAPGDRPLAAPRAVALRDAEPAKVLGWLLLAGWGTFGAVETVRDYNRVAFASMVVCYGLLLGFVTSHRHPGTRFARWWVAFFSGLVVVAAVAVKAAELVLAAGE